MPRTRRIGILAFNDVQALDVIGPSDAFTLVRADDTDTPGVQPYEITVIGVTGRRVTAESGVMLQANVVLPAPRLRLDTLIIPGGRGIRGPVAETVAAWIRERAPRIRRIAAVCTGIYGLAPTGLIDGRHVTTHWRFAADLARRYPALRVDADALYLKDGPFYTSAGITAGIDLALALIEEDCGPRAALATARDLVMFVKRPGGQNQFSEPLQFQADSADRFADLVAWINGHLNGDLSVETLARRVFLSPRQFSRTFKGAYGTSPAAFVETMRLDEAGRRLAESRAPVDRIARSVGFASDDGFRRAFERRFGVSPRSYRARFAS